MSVHANDIAAARAALGLEDLAYVDLAVRRELQLVLARWPLLAGPGVPCAARGRVARVEAASRPRRLVLQGLRGGCGVTALVAALGHALRHLGQRVLMVDMSPDNLLAWHCNLPAVGAGGWARAAFDRQPWTASVRCLLPGLHLLPYGSLREAEQERLELFLRRTPRFWAQRLSGLARTFDWVIFDVPQRLPGHAGLDDGDLRLRVLEADPACHLLLQRPDRAGDWLLVNRFDPIRTLQRDLLLLWQTTLGGRLVPQCVHEDEAVREALARQLPLRAHAPSSLAAGDVLGLAGWCLACDARHGQAAEMVADAAEIGA